MNQELYEKLREMRLPIMAEEYKDQSENMDTQNMTLVLCQDLRQLKYLFF